MPSWSVIWALPAQDGSQVILRWQWGVKRGKRPTMSHDFVGTTVDGIGGKNTFVRLNADTSVTVDSW